MTRWMVLSLVWAGAGACAGERPQFGTMRADDTSGDAGSDQQTTSSGTHSTTGNTTSGNTQDSTSANTQDFMNGAQATDQSSNTDDEVPTGGDDSTSGTDTTDDATTSDSSIVTNDTTSTTDDSVSTTDDSNDTPDSSAPAAMECTDGEVEACNDCGQRSCDAEKGTWGPCLPVEEPRCNDEATALHLCDDSGKWETQDCESADSINCTAACASPNGVAACVVSPVDGDGDGYFSAACEAAPGDDCNDTTQIVSPGSSEVCDGRDNDCDGYTDYP